MKPLSSLKERCIVWVWQHTPSCAEMSRLASRRLDAPLPLKLRLKMRLHFLICVWCARYFKQLDFLHHGAPGVDPHLATMPGRGLSSESRKRIIQRLRSGPD